MINVELKGGAVKEFENGTTPAEIAKSIGAGLYKSVVQRLTATFVTSEHRLKKIVRLNFSHLIMLTVRKLFGTQLLMFLLRQ